MPISYATLRTAPPEVVRAALRADAYQSHTAGLSAGCLQANLAIMPERYALDFMRYCQRNPKPCPITGVSDTGNPMMTTLGPDIDVRRDAPGYNIYVNGQLSHTQPNIVDLWAPDHVAFALGCSFTFERALQDAGIPLWHIDNNTTVPMYRTSLPTVPAGPFCGPMVVSMRMIAPHQVDLARDISRRYPQAHGAPIHVGDPAQIGIADLSRPDWGDAAAAEQGKIPVFWACGVTPQAALAQARLPLCITHKPGQMLITDISELAESTIYIPPDTTTPHSPAA